MPQIEEQCKRVNMVLETKITGTPSNKNHQQHAAALMRKVILKWVEQRVHVFFGALTVHPLTLAISHVSRGEATKRQRQNTKTQQIQRDFPRHSLT